MLVLCKVSARILKVFDYMVPSKYFSRFNGTGGFILSIILLQLLIGRVVGGRTGYIGDLDLEEHNVMHIENLAIKTIQSEDGDIIECVDIIRQHAFNHPMLKNHSIQMRPSFYHVEMESNLSSKSQPIKQIWQRSGSCPVGTIPIRRNTKEGLSRASVCGIYGGEADSIARVEQAVAKCSEIPYYGAKAALNVWAPYVSLCENSFSFMSIFNRGFSNQVVAGWAVYPQLFGDHKPRLFSYWRNGDGGCFNLRCSGFIQISSRVALGSSLLHVSSYNGPQYQMEVRIEKDVYSNWGLFMFGYYVGYWPASIFNNFLTGSGIAWGGSVKNNQINGRHTTTEMGSGHVASRGYQKAAYMTYVEAMNSGRHYVIPAGMSYTATNPGCYSIHWPTELNAPGASFYYGGHGFNGCG